MILRTGKLPVRAGGKTAGVSATAMPAERIIRQKINIYRHVNAKNRNRNKFPDSMKTKTQETVKGLLCFFEGEISS